MKRRQFIIKSAFAGAALSFGANLFSKNKFNKKILVGNPLRFPPELQSGESLILKNSNVEVYPGTTTQVTALNDSYPCPTIRVQKDSQFSVVFENQLNQEATIHWHGLIVPELMDGQPKDPVLPNSSYTYSFPIVQRAGTYFYHSHAHTLTAQHVYKGFAGFFIVEDNEELQLGLPNGPFDIPLLIQDRHSIYQPQFTYAPAMMDRMTGYLGDLPLINGTPNAYLEVQKTLYRFRLLNGSNARIYKIAFSDNSQFWVISTDVGLKEEAIQTNSFFLSPGERVDILFDFSSYLIGDSVSLQSLSFNGIGTQGLQMELLRFDISGSLSSGGTVPQSLSQINYYNILDKQLTRTFTLSQSGMGTGMHRINGLTYDMNRIDEIIPYNQLEEWKFINTTNNFHPMHIHGTMFQVYSRNGSTNLSPNDKGWKDTVLINPNETVSVLVKCIDYSGIYLLHCHNLEHEDDGMMINIKIDTPTSIEKQDSQPETFELYQNYPNPFNPNTTIKYSLLESNNYVNLSIFNSNGEIIEQIFEGHQTQGVHSFNWNAKSVASGNYLCKLNVNGLFKVIKLLYIK